MKIKFGVNTLVWCLPFSEKEMGLIDKVSDMGFEVIEITPGEEFRRINPEKLRKKLDDTNLEVTICAALEDSQDISSEDESVRENGIDFMGDLVKFARDIGAKIIGGPLYSALGKKRYLQMFLNEIMKPGLSVNTREF